MKKIIVFIVVVLCFMFYVSPAFSQYGQYEQPTPSYTILIDKMIAKVKIDKGGKVVCDNTLDFKDNLSATDPRFKASDQMCFRLKIKNTTNIRLTNITVKDFVPDYLEPIEGPGAYEANSRTIVFTAGDFEADEEKIYFLRMQIFPQNKLPSDKGLFCLINKAQAYNDLVFDDDAAQYCIEKEVVGVPQVPSAGPEMGMLLFTAEIALLAIGVKIKSIKFK